MILSLGGASAFSSFASADAASQAGQYLWNAYGGGSGVTRPLGNNIMDGFDLDIESNPGGNNIFYASLVNTLRSNFASDPAHKYVITGAPQCPIPEPNMGDIISNSQFDYLWIQFYNNNDYAPDPCSLGLPGDAPFNYNNWTSYIANTPSKNAKLFVGVPVSHYLYSYICLYIENSNKISRLLLWRQTVVRVVPSTTPLLHSWLPSSTTSRVTPTLAVL